MKKVKSASAGVPTHYEFPRSRKEILSSLNLVLEDKETIYQEYDRLQNYAQEQVTGDTDNAVNEDNKGKKILGETNFQPRRFLRSVSKGKDGGKKMKKRRKN